MGRRLKVINYESIFTNIEEDDTANNIYKGDANLNIEMKEWGN
jgi:hypothetical protein